MEPVLDLIGIVVDDMARSLAFYRTLGLDIPLGVESEPHVEVTMPNGTRLAWDQIDMIRTFNADFSPSDGDGRVGLAFLCRSPSDVDTHCDKLAAAGYPVHLPPWDAFWGQRYATVHDPDGNAIDLFAPLDAA
jgi:catechol 2,3-dioxygenase-like lactoylglutathione lyase family enzyme